MKITNNQQLKKTSGQESPFLSLEVGDTLVRVIGDVFAVREHNNVKVDGKPRFPVCPTEQARMEIAAGVRQDTEVPPCPLCELGYPVKTTYMSFVVEREREEFNKKGQKITLGGDAKILKKGATLFGPIQALLDDDNWGKNEDYDVKITATGEGLGRKYSVIGVPASKSLPLTEGEKRSLADLQAKENLEEKCEPRAYAELQEEFGNIPAYEPEA